MCARAPGQHHVTADVLSFEIGTRMLRGPAAEAARKSRIKDLWREAKRRAYHGMVHRADVALFGMAALLEQRSPIYAGAQLTILPDTPAQAAG